MGRAEKNSFWKVNKTADLNVREPRGALKHRTPSREYLKNGSCKNEHAPVNSK